MKFLLLPLLLFTLLIPKSLKAQETTTKKDKVAKALNDYFHLERENIHVHFDKKIFLTNEKIWFKGYVFHRKMNMPFFATTNIYATLMDPDGKVIDTQLLYGNLASFSGSFALGSEIKSGKYYLQFYTNWMNNFVEDESAVYEVDIINPAEGVASNLGKPNLSKININFHPEGGTLVKDCINSIGISVTDCNGIPVEVPSVNIVAAGGEVLKTIQLNKMGYGRFDLLADNISEYKAEVTINGKKHQASLPPAQLTGVSLTVNNHTMPDKLIALIKTNSITKSSFGNQPLFMVIQQDAKVAIVEFNFSDGKTEQTLVIPQSDIFEGTNTIRILDANLNQIAERLLFKYPAKNLTAEMKTGKKTTEYTEFTAKLNYPTMNVSVSVLPDATTSLADDSDIYSSFLIAPYIKDKNTMAARYFLESYSRAKHYELDLFLACRESKYNWRDIMLNPPKSSYTFDMGVSLKATINQNIKNKKDCKVRVVSPSGMFDELVDIDDKGEIKLDNLILADSSRIQFSLLEKGVKKQELKLYPQIFNNIRKYNKAFKPVPATCAFDKNSDPFFAEFDLPNIPENNIVLEAVEMTANKKELKHARTAGNGHLRGYKIAEDDTQSFFYILDFIKYHGFDVQNDGANISIYGRTVNTINGQRTQPMIYIDNMMVLDFAMLLNVQTEDVDEFYINQHAAVPSVDNRMGIIRIYMKKQWSRPSKGVQDTNFIVTNGYKAIIPFENIIYSSTSDSGFTNFGLIDWEPTILADGNGVFTLKIPNTSQKTVKLLIEGFSADGKLISEVKTISLN